MKCTHEVQKQLLALSQAHLELERLEAQAVSLPEKQQLDQALQASAVAHSSEISSRMTTHELDSILFKLNSDIAKLRRRENDDRQTLGTTEDREYRRDLLHDLNASEKRRMALEKEREEIEAKRDAYIKDQDVEKDEAISAGDSVAAARRALDEAMSSIARRVTETERSIASISDRIPPNILELYSHQREDHGIGAARLVGRQCRGCFMELDNATINEFNGASPDELLRCPECATILLREEL